MNRRFCLILFILFCNTASFSQFVSGKFIDKASKVSIGYCTIGVIGKNIGSVGDRDGNFTLNISNINDSDTLVVSILGYEPISINGFIFKSKSNHVFELSEKSYLLEGIEIVDNPENIFLGDSKTSRFKGFNGWSGLENAGIGKSIGLLFDINKEILLEELFIHIEKNAYDSSLLRLHLYSLDERFSPKDELLTKDILFTVYQSKGWYKLDLRKFSINLKQDFGASIEWINSWGVRDKSEMLTISRTPNKPGISIYRSSPQGYWSRQEGSSAPAIHFKGIVIDSINEDIVVKHTVNVENGNSQVASFSNVLPQVNNNVFVVRNNKPNDLWTGKKKEKIGIVNSLKSTDGGSGFIHEPTNEVGSLLKGPSDLYRLDKFNFHLKYNSFDSILFELNLYQLDDNGQLLSNLNQGIKFKIGKSKGWQEFSLAPYDIYLKGDVLVTLKAIKGITLDKKPKDLYFTLGVGTSYVREVNNNDWSKREETCRAFNLLISY
ncbi:carboxypeptidase-like regulatory domain-containing protein [Chryseotalea sanaruensis]|nr:carboxypeptidase-like regulatory domain-containing protein [Chryseotalea sanaruensis]